MTMRWIILIVCLSCFACDEGGDLSADMGLHADMGNLTGRFGVTELMAKNEGAWVDEMGETDDWIEFHNGLGHPINLGEYQLSDDVTAPHNLPDITLSPGQLVLLWADDSPEQGDSHLPFKLSSGGETLYFWGPDGVLIESIDVPPLAPNEAYGVFEDDWARCAWASPERFNFASCGPPAPTVVENEIVFEPYEWPEPWPFAPNPLVITELALRPAAFVEVLNVSDQTVELEAHALRLSPHRPGESWPTRDLGEGLAWPQSSLRAGERIVVPVIEAQIEALAANDYEGVITSWHADYEYPLERIDFMAWPEGAALSRSPDATGRHRFCAELSPGEGNTVCEPLLARPVPGRLRHLRTPGDFATLAEGGTAVGIDSIKYIMDLEGGGAVHLLGARDWGLHYTFVREVIDGDPHLDRCDPDENEVFVQGWRAFSDVNYRSIENRRYLLGTLVHHGGSGMKTVEYSGGDRISPDQMRLGFFGAASHTDDHQAWSIRAQTDEQIQKLRTIEGRVPAVGPLAPFSGITYQALTATVGYGVLTFVPAHELETTPLGPQVIVLTDSVPNDIALTGGLITEAFQTPLAHVNLLSRNRDTPNMALYDARNHSRISPFLGKLVRLEVAGADFSLREALPEEAEAFWTEREPGGEPARPRLDPSARGVHRLESATIDDLPRLGAKAAQLAELARVNSSRDACPGLINTPRAAMAIPLVHSLEHYEASGATALLSTLIEDAEFRADPSVRAEGLARVRDLVMGHRVDDGLLLEVEAYVQEHFGAERVRFRSSSNTEDLPGFNGAGLYTSISAELGNEGRSIENAIRTVWASLYLMRAYDERRYHNIAMDDVAMGVLVHLASLGEKANGVGISRNILQPIRNQYYINLQIGEASVANPAPGVTTEQLIYDARRNPRVRVLARSSLARGEPVLDEDELERAACSLRAIHDHFKPILDPADEDRWFAMDIEFKLRGEARELLVKQARPYSFGSTPVPADCREL